MLKHCTTRVEGQVCIEPGILHGLNACINFWSELSRARMVALHRTRLHHTGHCKNERSLDALAMLRLPLETTPQGQACLAMGLCRYCIALIDRKLADGEVCL